MPTDLESRKTAGAKSEDAKRLSKSKQQRSSKRREPPEPAEPVDEQLDEDEDEDDEDDEDRPSARAKSTRPSPAAKRISATKRKKNVPRTEGTLDSPNKQTIGMLGVVALCTLVLWGFARAACNYHPPRESRKPRVVSTQELAGDPKNAAIEFQQRWALHEYGEAMVLASGPLANELRQKALQCEKQADSCQKEQAELKDHVNSVGELLRRDMSGALVRVTTYGPDSPPQKYLLKVESDGALWKVKSRVKDTGQPLPPPTPTAAPPSPEPPAAASEAPAPSPTPVPTRRIVPFHAPTPSHVAAPPHTAAPTTPPHTAAPTTPSHTAAPSTPSHTAAPSTPAPANPAP